MTKARNIASLLSTANGKIAGNNLDVSFENITDTGTEGTRVATGTTAQRGSTTGQLRFNTTTGLAEYYTGTVFKSIDTPPIITSVDVTNVETELGGTQTFVITGSLFNGSATVKFRDNGGTLITPDTTTVNSASQITVTKTRSSFSNANEPYDVIVSNPSGLEATLDNQINVDNSPVWSTSSGNIGSVVEGASANFTVSATDPDGDTVSYSETTSNLSGAGFSLSSSTGAITGTATDVGSDTTNTFTLRATAGAKFADRSFNIITTNIPSFATILNSNSVGANDSRNLAILIDPANYTSGVTATNESGHPVANSTTPLNNLTIGGSGVGKYFLAGSGSGGRYMHFGNPTGLTDSSSDSWAYAGWWRFPWEVDDTGNSNIGWILNDGDWSPPSQIGIRYGQGNGFYIHSGGTTGLANFGLPSAAYTDKWIFLAIWHRVSGGRFVAQGFATDTNLTLHASDGTGSSAGSSSGHNLTLGARADNLNATIPQGTLIGGQMAWFASNGTNSFISSSESASDANAKFEAIFDASKGRYV